METDTISRRDVLKRGSITGSAVIFGGLGIVGGSETATAQRTECKTSIGLRGVEKTDRLGNPIDCVEGSGCTGLRFRFVTNSFSVGIETVTIWGDGCDGPQRVVLDSDDMPVECPTAYGETIFNECWEVGGKLNILIRYCENCKPTLVRTTVPSHGEQKRFG